MIIKATSDIAKLTALQVQGELKDGRIWYTAKQYECGAWKYWVSDDEGFLAIFEMNDEPMTLKQVYEKALESNA